MLRENAKLNNEYYKLDIIRSLIDTFTELIKVSVVEVQEELKSNFLNTLKTIFPNVNLNIFCSNEDIANMLILLYNGQNELIQNLQKENRENEKTSIYKVVANISITVGMKLNPNELSVAEFVEYYKIAEENGK